MALVLKIITKLIFEPLNHKYPSLARVCLFIMIVLTVPVVFKSIQIYWNMIYDTWLAYIFPISFVEFILLVGIILNRQSDVPKLIVTEVTVHIVVLEWYYSVIWYFYTIPHFLLMVYGFIRYQSKVPLVYQVAFTSYVLYGISTHFTECI